MNPFLAFKISRARRSLIALTELTTPRYQTGWVHRVIAEKMQAFSIAVAAGKSPRLLLSMPPRHGKSTLAERLAVFHLGHNPWHEIIFAGYALEPAKDRSKHARDVAMSDECALTFPDLVVSRDSRAKSNWTTTQGGGCYAVGVGGSIVSKGAHVLIIDDPVKGWLEASSALVRDKGWDWYTGDARNRLAPGGGVLCIQTRWHLDDLTGRLIEFSSHEGYESIRFPAVAEVDEEYRKAGEALHPERYDLESLDAIRETMGPQKWEALFQQNPTTPGGSVWERAWFKYWTADRPTPAQHAAGFRQRPERFDRVVASWDLTFGSTSKRASFVVGQVWGQSGRDFFLLEEVRGRWGFGESLRQIKAQLARYPGIHAMLIEKKANGAAILEQLAPAVTCRLVPVEPKGSKIARAHACAGILENGHVFLPDPASFAKTAEYLDECCAFPDSANDDRVDTTSQALIALARSSSVIARPRGDR